MKFESLAKIESLISSINNIIISKIDNDFVQKVKLVENNFFDKDVGLVDHLVNVALTFSTISYHWNFNIPTIKEIIAKLKRMENLTSKLLSEFHNPHEITILENLYGKIGCFDSRWNFSLIKQQLEHNLSIYRLILKDIPPPKRGKRSEFNYRDIVRLLIPFFRQKKQIFTPIKKHGDDNTYLGDEVKYIKDVMPLLKELNPYIELVTESSIGEEIIKINKENN